jgi:hypothetical protein
MRLYKWPATRLAFVPGIIEALYDAGLAVAVFGMPFTLALSLGFILKAVGPGLVVPAMFQLQKAGWGAVKGIPSTVVIAASFDDIIAITGFSIFSNVAIGGASSGDTAWQIASGPLQVLFGLAGGYLAGLILGATRLFDNKYKRLVGIYGSGGPKGDTAGGASCAHIQHMQQQCIHVQLLLALSTATLNADPHASTPTCLCICIDANLLHESNPLLLSTHLPVPCCVQRCC